MDSTCTGDVAEFPNRIRLKLAEGMVDASSMKPGEFRRAAVLMPLFLWEGEWQVLFTRRSNTVQDHKGQVSFPGGAAEETDINLAQTACRELEEEVGIPEDSVTILGRMSDLPTITSFIITPVVGVIPWPVQLNPNPIEVARVFSIPLCWLADPTHYAERLYRLQDGTEHPVIYFDEYNGELLWGVTARIVLNFLEKIGLP